MDKYFSSLDMAALRMQLPANSKKAMKLYRHVLHNEHDAGPEAGYIIKLWKQERGIDEKDNGINRT